MTGDDERRSAGTDRIERLIDGVRARDVRAVARAARMVDDRSPGYLELLRGLFAHAGGAYVLGVTGTPGSGKSTLVDRLVEHHRALGQTVAVVAVDPTSPFSGGAILGDRIRMQRHFLDDGVFIRSLATRGHLGGLSRSAGDVIRVFDAAGFDVVVIETVGVGQDELEVARHAETTIVVMAPGGGDHVQASKAGILEVADVFAVNKSDREGADATVTDLEQMIALGGLVAAASDPAPTHGHAAARAITSRRTSGEGWAPPVVKTVARTAEGLDELVEACQAHRRFLRQTPQGEARRRRARRDELLGVFRVALLEEAERRLARPLDEAGERVAGGVVDPYSEAAALVERLLGDGEQSVG